MLEPDFQPQLLTTRINWLPGVPDEVKASLLLLFEKFFWLLPRWCEELVVQFMPKTEDNAELSLLNSEEYRWVKLFIYPVWLQSSEEERAYNLIHEFVHASNGYLSDYLKRIIDAYVSDEKTREVLKSEWQFYVERSTQDITHCIYAKLYGELPAKRFVKGVLDGRNQGTR